MKLIVLDTNENGDTVVLCSQHTNLTDNSQLHLISVGEKIALLVGDDDAHKAGDIYNVTQ